MYIDISDLIRKKVESKEVHLDYKGDKFTDGFEEINFTKPVRVDGNICMDSDVIKLEADVKTELGFICSRCLEKFNYPMELKIEEEFTLNDSIVNEDIIKLNDDSIDISKVVELNIISELPIKRLCKEDCKGLCPNCGTNLNYSTCKCSVNNSNPEFARLKDLFN